MTQSKQASKVSFALEALCETTDEFEKCTACLRHQMAECLFVLILAHCVEGRMKDWSSEEVSELIRFYHMRHELWDSTCPNYRDKQLKRRVRQWLATRYNVSEPELKSKLHILRSRFCEKLRRNLSSDGMTLAREPAWQHFRELTFLKNPGQCGESCRTAKTDFASEAPAQCDSSDSEEEETRPKRAKKEVNTKRWSREETKRLIECIREYHELWDPACRNFRDRTWKLRLYGMFARQFATTAYSVERRIRSLRLTQRETVRLTVVGEDGTVLYRPRFPFFELLQFIDSPEVCCSPNCYLIPEEGKARALAHKSKRWEEKEVDSETLPVVSGNENSDSLGNSSTAGMADHWPPATADHQYRAFGEYICSELKSLPEARANTLKGQILQVVVEAYRRPLA